MQKAFHKVVKEIIISSVDLSERKGQTLRQVFEDEYGYNGHSPESCTAYLQGLPSVCTIPFENYKILEILEKNGHSKPTEKGRHGLIERYWVQAGAEFYKLTKE